MAIDNVDTLKNAGVLDERYQQIQAFLEELNALTVEEVAALTGIRAKVSHLEIVHSVTHDFC